MQLSLSQAQNSRFEGGKCVPPAIPLYNRAEMFSIEQSSHVETVVQLVRKIPDTYAQKMMELTTSAQNED